MLSTHCACSFRGMPQGKPFVSDSGSDDGACATRLLRPQTLAARVAAHEWVGVPSGKSGALNRSPFKSPQPKESGAALSFFCFLPGRRRGTSGVVHVLVRVSR